MILFPPLDEYTFWGRIMCSFVDAATVWLLYGLKLLLDQIQTVFEVPLPGFACCAARKMFLVECDCRFLTFRDHTHLDRRWSWIVRRLPGKADVGSGFQDTHLTRNALIKLEAFLFPQFDAWDRSQPDVQALERKDEIPGCGMGHIHRPACPDLISGISSLSNRLITRCHDHDLCIPGIGFSTNPGIDKKIKDRCYVRLDFNQGRQPIGAPDSDVVQASKISNFCVLASGLTSRTYC